MRRMNSFAWEKYLTVKPDIALVFVNFLARRGVKVVQLYSVDFATHGEAGFRNNEQQGFFKIPRQPSICLDSQTVGSWLCFLVDSFDVLLCKVLILP